MNSDKEEKRKFRDNNARVVIVSVVSSLLLLFLCYITDNVGYSMLTGPSAGQQSELLQMLAGRLKEDIPPEYLFINVAYDRELVPIYDDDGFPRGNIDITDRGRLNEFLSGLDNTHKYIMLDVLFSDNYRSDADSALTATLLLTPRIVIAKSVTANLMDSALYDIACYTDYATHILETNFVKYEFFKNNQASMPYKVWRELEPDFDVKVAGPFAYGNNHLRWRSLTLHFPIRLWEEERNTSANDDMELKENVILNLGSDILDMGVDISELVRDKIVVMGDFTENDIHDTYIGKVAGPVINVNALEALRRNKVEIPWWIIFSLLALYSGITYMLLKKIPFFSFFSKKLRNWIRRLRVLSRNISRTNKSFKSVANVLKKYMIRPIAGLVRMKIFKYALSLVSFTILFEVIASVVYYIDGVDINVLVPTVWFTSLKFISKTLLS